MGAPLKQAQNLVGLLEEWAKWQGNYSEKLSYPSKSAGFCPGGYVSKTFDEMADESDAAVCKIIDCAIDDLPPVYSAALYRRYLAVTFRFPRVSYIDALAEAHARLLVSLPAKGVVV